MPGVYIVGGDYLIERMFKESGWEISQILEDADLIQYTGGADISPHLYGEKNVGLSFCDERRDAREFEIFEKAKSLGKYQSGVCRGGQLINCLNGGRMYQDVTKHAIGGTHAVEDLETGEILQLNSTHHQQFIPGNGALVVATANLGGIKRFMDGTKIKEATDPVDYEVVYYEKSLSLAYQPHPEYGIQSVKDYYFKLLHRFFGL